MADEIDLLNVSFEGEAAPDRVTARAGVKELRKIAPLRKYDYVNFLLLEMVLHPGSFLFLPFQLLGAGNRGLLLSLP